MFVVFVMQPRMTPGQEIRGGQRAKARADGDAQPHVAADTAPSGTHGLARESTRLPRVLTRGTQCFAGMVTGDGTRDALRTPEDFFADALATEQGHGGLLLSKELP
jgi:hypothetical protein